MWIVPDKDYISLFNTILNDITMAEISGKAYDISLLKRIYQYVKPYKRIFILSVILTILTALIAPVRPFLISYTLDHYIINDNKEWLLYATIVMVVLMVLQAVITYGQTMQTNLLGESAIKDLRIKVFNHITSLKLRFFDKTPIGQIITRTVSDLETISNIFSEGLISIVGDILQVIVLLVVMLYTDWKLTLIVILPMPLLIFATMIFKEAIKTAFQDVRSQVANLNTFLQEHITGVAITQYFSRENQEYDKFLNINKKYRNANIRSNWYYSIFYPVVDLISAVSIALLVWFGAKSILSHPLQVSAGTIAAFIMYINMLFRPIRQLADKFNTLQMGMVGAERVFKVLDNHDITENKGTLAPHELRGDVSFKNVWFAYIDEQYVLKNINFDIQKGETVALVGATGAGKSSTINILNRLYDIQKGEITVDGVPIQDYEISYLRSNIATVLQDVFLFSDTILNNITIHNPHISREQVIEAAKMVGAHDFIMKLPGQYDYQVMERGNSLSAGQAQLISFVRALVYNPTILVLDEATSSIDTETEMIIQNALETLMKGRTSIIIAHRLSTIQKANKIIVMDKGEIKEMGTHQELLQANQMYKKLYDLQFNSEGIHK